MTLPFRRRHHDDETGHDRARALFSREMLEPLPADDAGWLIGHLDGCAECRRDRSAYLADRELLRSLRAQAPEPPRDLWARTSAALEREARNRHGRSADTRGDAGRRGAGAASRWRGLPFGAAAGALIVLVVVGASLVPPAIPPSQTPGGSAIAAITPESEPTPFQVAAGRVGWIQAGVDGSWDLIITDVDAVCPRTRPRCQPLGEGNAGRAVDLGGVPTGVTISPTENQLVVESQGDSEAADRILVVAVPTTGPAATPTPVVTLTPTETATSGPATEPPGSAPASPAPTPATPDGAIEIASGVTVVGEAEYSTDGRWLAFSARPSDGSTGPDLYLWSVGDPAAIAVTRDHQTYFSAWLDGRVLASRVEAPAAVSPGESPAASSPVGPLEAHPSSFLIDPATLSVVSLGQPDMWLPVVDPTGRFVAYWSGTLAPTADGLAWELGTGRLVLDGWSTGAPAPASSEPAPTETTAPPSIGPAGTPIEIVAGQTAAFRARFDPSGTRLAVWVGEQSDAAVGRLHLIVLDATTGAINPGVAPLPGAPALRRFSIDVGRLAWVSPRGQDGQESSVQVLGWSKDEFGEIRTIPARDLYIVR